ncbi:hypothetical protein [Cognatiyoonia sp. IB215182]|uniref:ATP-grasp domain-containing protein n=1 Tax=Cognatiyoonia sp. IB215182 TaxID=3097353 RepID=UPI002A17C732|nr:hypothetical protein [Cognatiyoonia sp. IB215182]MDX8355654.1 hypothetical protein [Cognatiyoonia sp. IB215182]
MDHLRAIGLPVPETETHSAWEAVRSRSTTGSIFVKAVSGVEGRGAGVSAFCNGAPPEPPFPGPWHVETTQLSDGFDRKLYVAGDQVFGLLKPWPRRDDAPTLQFEPTNEMAALALKVGQAVGSEIYGVDLVGKGDVFSIVDVNPFPGFRGVAGAPQAIARYIANRVVER